MLLVVSTFAFSEWFSTGVEKPDQATPDRHHLSECWAIPGAFNSKVALADAKEGVLSLGADDSDVAIEIDVDEIRLGKAASSFVAKADLVMSELQSIVTGFNGHTHVVAGVTTGPGSVVSAIPGSSLSAPGDVAADSVKVQ